MKFKLNPKWEKLDRQTPFILPPHGPVVFAAILPDYVDVEFIDENIQAMDFDKAADFVGISVMLTAQIKRGWEIADNFRKKGVKVMFGGIATMLHAEETQQHAERVRDEGRMDRYLRILKQVSCKNFITICRITGQLKMSGQQGVLF